MYRYSTCAVVHRSVLSDSLQPYGCSPPGSSVHGLSPGRILEWVAMPSSRGSSQPGIKPKPPTLQADSLPSEQWGKPKNTWAGSLSLLQGNFLTQESNWGLLHCRQILYQLSYPQENKIAIKTAFCPLDSSKGDTYYMNKVLLIFIRSQAQFQALYVISFNFHINPTSWVFLFPGFLIMKAGAQKS